MKIKLFIILSIVIFPLGIANRSTAIAQTSQPRQTPTANPVNAVNKTPTNTDKQPVHLANNGIETPTAKPVNKTPTNPATKPVPPAANGIKTPTVNPAAETESQTSTETEQNTDWTLD